jgi:hypothetical protein
MNEDIVAQLSAATCIIILVTGCGVRLANEGNIILVVG